MLLKIAQSYKGAKTMNLIQIYHTVENYIDTQIYGWSYGDVYPSIIQDLKNELIQAYIKNDIELIEELKEELKNLIESYKIEDNTKEL